MVFNNLGSVLENDQSIYEAVNQNMNGGQQNNPNKFTAAYNVPYEHAKKQHKISTILRTLSHYGMNYSDKVMKNMHALPADKLLQSKGERMVNQSIYGNILNNWKVKPEEEKTFAEKTLNQKREILRRMAMQPELEDILDIMTNEAIVPDDNNAYICDPYVDEALIQDLNENAAEEIKGAMDVSFYKIYMLLDWKNTSWDQFKRWLIDGVLAFEIIYDDLEHPRTIIGIIPLDPATLTKEVIDGTTYWIQFKGGGGRERKMIDAQIIYIKYEDTQVSLRQSYLERLIRPFNMYRIVEQAQVIWTVTQSSFKTMFTIPVGGQSKAKGAQTLRQAMNSYREDIKFNTETGELMVNGSTNLPFNQEYWMPENEQGKPEIETIVDNGPSLNDSDQIKFFQNKLYSMSKIPSSRFEKDAQSAWFGTDPTQALREEINFTRFVNKMRDVFALILLKPLRIQISLQVPDLKNDKRILNAISLHFNSYNPFEEMMNIEIMNKRIEFISSMNELAITDSEGNQIPYFSLKFLVERFLRLSDADIELNEKYKLQEKLAANNVTNTAEEENNESESGGSKDETEEGDAEETGEEEEDNGNSGGVDKEMLGTVQPESSETTEA